MKYFGIAGYDYDRSHKNKFYFRLLELEDKMNVSKTWPDYMDVVGNKAIKELIPEKEKMFKGKAMTIRRDRIFNTINKAMHQIIKDLFKSIEK